MLEIIDGRLRLHEAPFDHRVSLAWRTGNAWRPLTLRHEGDALVTNEGPLRARLSFAPGAARGAWQYALAFTSAEPTRLRLLVELTAQPAGRDAFHLIPSFLFGDNNLGRVPPDETPNLTHERREGTSSCSPVWECRADRASHPVSLAVWGGGLAGVSIQPYSDGLPLAGFADDEAFIRNGLVARLAADGEHAACGATLGYGNLPFTYVGPKRFGPPTAHFTREAEARGTIYLRKAADRRAVHPVIRELYAAHRERPASPLSRDQAARDLVRGFLDINWHGDNGSNADGSSSGVATPFFGGKPFRRNFTNMRSTDEPKRHLRAWRTLPEVGWTGGGVIGYPLLVAGVKQGNARALELAIYKLDWAAKAFNAESGLLWDVCGEDEGKRLNWWWSAPPVMDCHCAYTNASGVYYLLKAHRFAAESPGVTADMGPWLRTALSVLDTVIGLQLPDGNLGYTYRADRPEVLDAEGFAGAWFIPALALAYRQTRERRYLDAAVRALAYYHADVRNLSCWGTPMDVGKMLDHEGNLGFLRGAVLLHEATGSDEFLPAAVDSAGYEYLWRYGHRARPQFRPLRGSPWNSCGGSITSSGTSMHPMGVFITRDLARLAETTGDGHHLDRADDGADWGANCVALYPEHTGYGSRGVMSERWCPSDGATFESYPDGTPASMWFSYNGWAAAAVLEGLME